MLKAYEQLVLDAIPTGNFVGRAYIRRGVPKSVDRFHFKAALVALTLAGRIDRRVRTSDGNYEMYRRLEDGEPVVDKDERAALLDASEPSIGEPRPLCPHGEIIKAAQALAALPCHTPGPSVRFYQQRLAPAIVKLAMALDAAGLLPKSEQTTASKDVQGQMTIEDMINETRA